ncbi:MAG: malonyl-CoA decarboxylase domain-containing protein, partial [Acidimicrobiales bacterium]
MVSARLDRMVRYVRRWRMTPDDNDALPVASDLPDPDLRRLRRLVDDCVEGRGGEVTARTTARTIGATFTALDVVGRRRFFELLAVDYGIDDQRVDVAIDNVIRASDPAARVAAEAELRRALEPRRERLLRRFAGVDGGLPFLVTLREDLRTHLGQHPDLAEVDADLKRILDGWFDVALLRLDRLTWDSSATLLERLIDYEAVHAIESWNDLKGRLGPGRRCYAFLHPSMPDDPLIFVEVALTEGIAADLPSVLDHSSLAESDHSDADTAIFYSISNCHDGLAGVRLGDFLIKSVVEQLADDLPTIRNFATLSPLPGLRRWLQHGVERDEISLTEAEREHLMPNQS